MPASATARTAPWRTLLLVPELLQQLVPNREAEWADLLADAAGIALGAALASAWLWRRTAPQ